MLLSIRPASKAFLLKNQIAKHRQLQCPSPPVFFIPRYVMSCLLSTLLSTKCLSWDLRMGCCIIVVSSLLGFCCGMGCFYVLKKRDRLS